MNEELEKKDGSPDARKEHTRRGFFGVVAGGAAAAVGLGADAAEAQRVTKSVDNPAMDAPDIIGNRQGMTQEYRRNYEGWVRMLVTKNEKVMKEIAAVAELPLEDKGYAELIFSSADNSLPRILEIIEGNGERIIMHINRWSRSLREGEVAIFAGTYVPNDKAAAYKAKGVYVDDLKNSNEIRILRASIGYQTKTGQFRRL